MFTMAKQFERVEFDPSNKEHLKDYAHFLETSNWKNGCRYLLEQPYCDIPTMINNKLVRHWVKNFTKRMEKV